MYNKLSALILFIIIFLASCTGQNNETSTKVENGISAGDEIRNPLFSPDDSKIVFEAGSIENSDIYILDIKNNKISKLVYTTANEVTPTFSPDGRSIAFSSNGNIMSFVIETKQLEMLSDTGSDYSPEFTPDGKQIAFSSRRSGGSGIWIMSPDGTNQTLMKEEAMQPEFIPDGKYMAFAESTNSAYSFKFTTNPRDVDIGIFFLPLPSDNMIVFQDTIDASPRFDSEGRYIVYHSTGAELGEKTVIRMTDIGGYLLVQLITPYNHVAYPSFSHDGKKIVYVADNSHIVIKNTEDLQWERINPLDYLQPIPYADKDGIFLDREKGTMKLQNTSS